MPVRLPRVRVESVPKLVLKILLVPTCAAVGFHYGHVYGRAYGMQRHQRGKQQPEKRATAEELLDSFNLEAATTAVAGGARKGLSTSATTDAGTVSWQTVQTAQEAGDAPDDSVADPTRQAARTGE